MSTTVQFPILAINNHSSTCSCDVVTNADHLLLHLKESNQKSNRCSRVEYRINSVKDIQEFQYCLKKLPFSLQSYRLMFIHGCSVSGEVLEAMVKIIRDVDASIPVMICVDREDQVNNLMDKLARAASIYVVTHDAIQQCLRRIIAGILKRSCAMFRKNNHHHHLNGRRHIDCENRLLITHAMLEAVPSAIVVVDNNKKITTHNKKFLTLWGLAGEKLQTKDALLIVKQIAGLAEEPELFVATLSEYFHDPVMVNASSEWKLKDGRTIECSVDAHLLHNRQIGLIMSFANVTERKRVEDRLVYQATHDSLTSLPNRILLADKLRQGIAQAKRDKRMLGVLMIDLDHFKEVNDRLGHAAGDLLLRLVSQRLSYAVRELDTVIRLGGDEFVIVLASLKQADDAIMKARDIIDKFSEPFQLDDHSIKITTSVGISLFPNNGHEEEVLLKHADAALYHAKRKGRNAFQVYTQDCNEQREQHEALKQGLAEALEKQQFVLQYQPFLRSDNGQIVGFEALLRWQHPRFGLIYPSSFIQLAEETGLMPDIDDWVMKTACHQLKNWQTIFSSDLRLAINISGHQFSHHDFVKKVEKILVETSIMPGSLELDMSQNQFLRDIALAAQKMHALKALGVKLTIDDFGIGDAAFSYLKYFPFDKVKIDRGYIRGVGMNRFDEAMIEAIITMSRKIGVEVLVEGVENSQQAEFLLKFHSHQQQGYYYSAPLNADHCLLLLKNKKWLIEKIS